MIGSHSSIVTGNMARLVFQEYEAVVQSQYVAYCTHCFTQGARACERRDA